MAIFRYKAVSPAGEVVEGELEALNRLAVIDRLQADGSTPIRADAVGGATVGALPFAGLLRRRLSLADIALISQEMATLLRAGLPVDRALAILSSLAEISAKRAFVDGVLERVRSGATLADALQQRKEPLPSFYVGMIRAGEASGNLANIFARLAELLARARTVRESVKSALYYPIIVLIVACFTITVMLTVVVPEFRPLFDSAGASLPRSTQLVIAAGDIVRDYWWVGIIAIGVAATALPLHYAQPAGRLFWDKWLLKLPILGALILKLQIARFARTLGTLLSSGVVELKALSIATGTLTNSAITSEMDNVTARLKRGEGWSSPLRDTGVFPTLAVQLIQVGEESGQLETMLNRVADIFDDEVQQSLKRLLALLVPAVTVLLGLVVAAIVGAMLMAIMSTYNVPI